MHKDFGKEVCNHFRTECPRPALAGKVDPNMAIFLKKFSRDPKRLIDRSWRSCQDKLLDLLGLLAKILEMTVYTKESGAPVDPDVLTGWNEKAI